MNMHELLFLLLGLHWTALNVIRGQAPDSQTSAIHYFGNDTRWIHRIQIGNRRWHWSSGLAGYPIGLEPCVVFVYVQFERCFLSDSGRYHITRRATSAATASAPTARHCTSPDDALCPARWRRLMTAAALCFNDLLNCQFVSRTVRTYAVLLTR